MRCPHRQATSVRRRGPRGRQLQVREQGRAADTREWSWNLHTSGEARGVRMRCTWAQGHGGATMAPRLRPEL